MSNYTVSDIGQNAGSGGSLLQPFLKVFSGEVITAFETANSTLDKHLVRTISSGKSRHNFQLLEKSLQRLTIQQEMKSQVDL